MVWEFAQLATLPCTFNQINANNAHTIAVFAPTTPIAITTAQRTIFGTALQDNAYQMELKEYSWPDLHFSVLSFICFSE